MYAFRNDGGPMRTYREQARLFKALAHPARLRILYALQEEG